ncbi:S8 family serine peptidase [Mycoplasma sp. NEAQ87857]|uniref:S8 family serine peptidase n=1 Tax=Mycoplasma sp. NEAQ87857 TaxID=2683967 RepID=UPI001318FA73|nr:S8 family serine peptidase [Mycoplasma sp. NEAQ87857]QGZ97553.1 S8 family serine peptidase [Mycoplasma sp. NEAQ87857]
MKHLKKRIFAIFSLVSVSMVPIIVGGVASNQKLHNNTFDKIYVYSKNVVAPSSLNGSYKLIHKINDKNTISYELSVMQFDYEFYSSKNQQKRDELVHYLSNNIKGKFKITKSEFTNFIFIEFEELNEKDNNSNLILLNSLEAIRSVGVNDDKTLRSMEKSLDNKINILKESDDYASNFKSNRFYKEDRNKIIDLYKKTKQRGKLGIWEPGGLVNKYDKSVFLNDENLDVHKVYNDWGWWIYYNDHATKVAGVASGKNGVNPFLNIYGRKIWNYKNDVEYYASKGVEVINASFGFKGEDAKNHEEYNMKSRYIDEFVRINPEHIIVFAAGNESTKLNGHQLSYNSIVVGANDIWGYRVPFSNKDSNTGRYPTLLANGLNYNFGKELVSGTSFSAPLISSILASSLITHKHIYDKGKNIIIAISALSSSTYSKNKYDSGELDKEYGAGIFDFQKWFNSLESLVYFNIKGDSRSTKVPITYPAKKEQLIKIKDVYVQKDEVLRGSLAWLFWGHYTNNKLTLPKVTDFDLILKDEQGNTVMSSVSGSRNIEMIKYKAKTSGKYSFYVKQFADIPHNESYDLAFTTTKGWD